MAVSKNTVLSALRDFKELQDAANAQKFVAKENGKQLSTNDFTDAYKNKLLSLKNYTLPAATTESLGGIIVGDGLEVTGNGTLNVTLTGGGESNIIEAISIDGDIQPIVDKTAILSLSDYAKKAEIGNGGSNIIEAISIDGDIQPIVNKVATLSLSNYAKKTDISNGELNIIEAISIDGKSQTISNKTAQLDLSNYAKKTDVGAGVRVKGSVNSFSQLPTTAVTGDLYNIKTAGGTDDYGVEIKAGDNVVRTDDNKWDVFAGLIDFSNYVTKDGNKVLSTNDFTNADKDKLNGLQNYTLSAATKVSLGGIIPGEGLGMAGDKLDILYGEGLSIANNTLTVTMVSGGNYDVFTGATNSRGGMSGLVPPPTTDDVEKFLRGNGTWSTVSAGNVVVMAGPSSNSVELGSYISNIQGALWYDLIDGQPALRLRYGDRTYNFYYDISEMTSSTAPALVSNVGIEYQLGTTPSTVQGGLWYQISDGVPVLYVHDKNFNYGFLHDNQTYVGDDSNLKSLLFCTSPNQPVYDSVLKTNWTVSGGDAIVTNNPLGNKSLACAGQNEGAVIYRFSSYFAPPWTFDFWLYISSNWSATRTGRSFVVCATGTQSGVNTEAAAGIATHDGKLHMWFGKDITIDEYNVLNKRTHFAFVCRGTGAADMHCYINGAEVTSATGTNVRLQSVKSLQIFPSRNTSANIHDGFWVDHFRFWDKAVWTGDFTVPDATEYT